MKTTIYIITILICNVLSTDTNSLKNSVGEKCDVVTLMELDNILKNGEKLTSQNFTRFFENMSASCKNNAEFSQYNNEILFKLLETYPKKFIDNLSLISMDKEKLNYILSELQNPIHDDIQLREISKGLSETKTDNTKTKELVSKSIKTAIDKYN